MTDDSNVLDDIDPLPDSPVDAWEAQMREHHEAYVRSTYRLLLNALDQHDLPITRVNAAILRHAERTKEILHADPLGDGMGPLPTRRERVAGGHLCPFCGRIPKDAVSTTPEAYAADRQT